jgi:hypothetical protein
MGALFGSNDSYNRQQSENLKKQEAKILQDEQTQLRLLKSRQLAAGSGGRSQTLFSQILGMDNSLLKNTLG